MSQPRMDNGEWMMRAQREAQQRAYEHYARAINPLAGPFGPYPRVDPPIAGEPEREDTTGLKMLDEFLQKRRKDHGDPDKRK